MSGLWKLLGAGARRLEAEGGYTLRLLSARETLEAERESGELAKNGREKALCANACLLARALEKDGVPVFSDGGAVLEGLSARKIGDLARRWSEFDRAENPSVREEERAAALKKVWSTRRKNGCAGVCSRPSACCPVRSGPQPCWSGITSGAPST